MSAATTQAVEELTLAVLARMNDDLPTAERITADSGTPIMGDGGMLDSLGIANFIVGMEEAVERSFGTSVPLSDQDLMNLFEEPTVTVRSFATYLANRINA